MAIENKGKPNTATTKGKKRKQYLPHNKAVKKKGAYPLRPGVQGFFITCDGGRERQAAHEAINVIDTATEETKGTKEDGVNIENQADNFMEPPAKKQCRETDTSKCETNGKEKSIDKLIEAELKELGDKSKRRFINLDSGCNGVVFVQMRKKEGDPGPKDIAQHMMTSAASTRKHMSRFILRVLPVEVACYASEEEITRAIKPLIAQYFPVETQNPWKFAVLYEARANSGIDRMKIINSVAKSIPAPHKVDLSNPDMTIVVEIIKTVCLIGVVEKYKELAKFNLRQLTSPKQ
ncbi:THUMP domain - like 2 [Theobroma cacao]|nr:THUMP domain - like 2 [Theobroma cacao]